MGGWILALFTVQFAILAVVAVFQRNPGLALYGVGGAILNIGILMMGQ